LADAITLLKDDHRNIKKLFRDFQAAGDQATIAKGKLVKRIIEELTVHTYLENEVMYPEVRALLPLLEREILESFEEHHVVDVLCMELTAMKPDAERFNAKMIDLIENVTHHIKEEEQDWFPKVRARLTRTPPRDIGARLAEQAPQHPAAHQPTRTVDPTANHPPTAPAPASSRHQ